VDKLICSLSDKERYVVQHKALKFYLKLGLKIKKIHRGMEFNEDDWLTPYIAKNTEERKKVKSKSEKNFFKLMNNAVFGKTMENVRNRVDLRMATSKKQINNLARKTNYQSFNIISENLTSVRMRRSVVMLDKPIYLGAVILDLSKIVMYDFWYNYIKPTWGDRVKLIMTDTDSLFVHIETDDVDVDILKRGDHLKYFDHSNYKEDCDNKMELGFMKNETGGKEISDACAIRAKMYAFRMSDGSDEKKTKGVRGYVVKSELTFDDYVNCMKDPGKRHMVEMNGLRSYHQTMYSETVSKVGLSANDDKRTCDL
jgi:hypothetical protein